MAGFGFGFVVVVVRTLVRCMVGLVVLFVMADFLFLLWRSWSERGLRAGRYKAFSLQFFNLQLCSVLSAIDVIDSIIVVDERGAGIRPIKHPLPSTCVAKVFFPGAVVAVGWASTPVFFPLLYRRT